MGDACSKSSGCCSKCANNGMCDNEGDNDLMRKGDTSLILARKFRMIVELHSMSTCKMDVVLYNRSDQICGQMSTQNLASFHRSEIECFEDDKSHMLQVDTSKIHDEIQSLEFRLHFEKAGKQISASVGMLEDCHTKELMCEFDMTKLPRTSTHDFTVAKINRSASLPDSWIVETILDFSARDDDHMARVDAARGQDSYLRLLLDDEMPMPAESGLGRLSPPTFNPPPSQTGAARDPARVPSQPHAAWFNRFSRNENQADRSGAPSGPTQPSKASYGPPGSPPAMPYTMSAPGHPKGLVFGDQISNADDIVTGTQIFPRASKASSIPRSNIVFPPKAAPRPGNVASIMSRQVGVSTTSSKSFEFG